MQNSGLRNMIGCCDNLADSLRDPLLLIGRILIAAVFLMTVWTGGPAAAYLKSLNYILPDFMSLLAHLAEWIIVVTLVLGVATRVGALIAVAFILVASVTAHQYWHYPEAGQLVQATYLAKNFAALGGALLVFAVGAGRYSVDAKMLGKA